MSPGFVSGLGWGYEDSELWPHTAGPYDLLWIKGSSFIVGCWFRSLANVCGSRAWLTAYGLGAWLQAFRLRAWFKAYSFQSLV